MNERAYILIDAVEGKVPEMVAALRASPGIVMADHIDGPPDIIMIIEAEDRLKLARLTINALNSIENLTDDIQCFPINNGNGSQSQF